MDNKKISELVEKTTLEDTDFIPLVDESSNPTETKKITIIHAKTALKGDKGADGNQFTWKGAWLTGTVYSANDCIQEIGSGYICIVPHTSGTFATDLAAGKWSLFVQGA